MKDERSRTRRVGDFLAGKGFYVVLFACLAVIGVSAWILLSTGSGTGGADADTDTDGYAAMEYTPDVYGDLFGSGGSENVFSNQQTPSPEPSAETPVPFTEPTLNAPETANTPEAPEEAPKSENNAPAPKTKTLADMTYVWPVAGAVERGFAVDGLIYSRTMADWRVHPGVDIAAAVGTKVQAIADGTVTDVYEDDLMGTTVIIDHGNNLRSIYSNLAGEPVVVAGDSVTMGAVIGAVGDTAAGEIGEAAHLHLEMTLEGDAVDPVSYLPTR